MPVSRVQGLEEAVNSSIASERKTFVESAQVPLVRLPWLFDGEALPWRSPAPRLGEHTLEILSELGFDHQRCQEWVATGVVMAAPEH